MQPGRGEGPTGTFTAAPLAASTYSARAPGAPPPQGRGEPGDEGLAHVSLVGEAVDRHPPAGGAPEDEPPDRRGGRGRPAGPVPHAHPPWEPAQPLPLLQGAERGAGLLVGRDEREHLGGGRGADGGQSSRGRPAGPAVGGAPGRGRARRRGAVYAGGVAAIALVGLVPAVAELGAAARRSEGHAVVRRPLDADAVRDLGRAPPEVVVLDGHPYANTRALLTDLRAQEATQALPVVVLGPARPAEVPRFEVVQRLGRACSLAELLAAVRRAAGTLGG